MASSQSVTCNLTDQEERGNSCRHPAYSANRNPSRLDSNGSFLAARTAVRRFASAPHPVIHDCRLSRGLKVEPRQWAGLALRTLTRT